MTFISLLTNPAVLRAALVLAIVIGLFGFGYSKGAASVQADWDAEKLETEKAISALKEEHARLTNKIITDYQTELSKIKGMTITIVKKVPTYVPSNSCPMPAGFRVLHDAAALNQIPGAPIDPDAAPSAVGDPGR